MTKNRRNTAGPSLPVSVQVSHRQGVTADFVYGSGVRNCQDNEVRGGSVDLALFAVG